MVKLIFCDLPTTVPITGKLTIPYPVPWDGNPVPRDGNSFPRDEKFIPRDGIPSHGIEIPYNFAQINKTIEWEWESSQS